MPFLVHHDYRESLYKEKYIDRIDRKYRIHAVLTAQFGVEGSSLHLQPPTLLQSPCPAPCG